MFRGLILVIFLAAGVTNAQSVSHNTGHQTAAPNAHTNPKAEPQPIDISAIKDSLNGIGSALIAANNKQPTADEKSATERNLKAQENLVFWAGAMFFLGFVEIALTVVGVIFVWLTLKENRRTATAATNQVTASQAASTKDLRPYVSLSIDARKWPNLPVIGVTGQQSYVWNRYSIVLKIKNTGKTWAQNVRIQRESPENPTGDAWQAITWDVAGLDPFVLAPGEEISLQFGDIPRPVLPAITSGQSQIFFAAWIVYDDPLTQPPTQRQTRLYRRLNADAEEGVNFTWMPTNNCADDSCA
jgi:hypothetical protein